MLMKVQETFHSSASFRRIREELDGQSNFDGMSKTERAEYATFFEDFALLRRGGDCSGLNWRFTCSALRLYGAGKTRDSGQGWIVMTNGGACSGRSPRSMTCYVRKCSRIKCGSDGDRVPQKHTADGRGQTAVRQATFLVRRDCGTLSSGRCCLVATRGSSTLPDGG